MHNLARYENYLLTLPHTELVDIYSIYSLAESPLLLVFVSSPCIIVFYWAALWHKIRHTAVIYLLRIRSNIMLSDGHCDTTIATLYFNFDFNIFAANIFGTPKNYFWFSSYTRPDPPSSSYAQRRGNRILGCAE